MIWLFGRRAQSSPGGTLITRISGLSFVPLVDGILSVQRTEVRCIMGRMRKAPKRRRGGSFSAVSCGPAWTIPSPVSMSCSGSWYGKCLVAPSPRYDERCSAINDRSRTGPWWIEEAWHVPQPLLATSVHQRERVAFSRDW